MTDKELIEMAAKAAGMKVNLEQQLEREVFGFGHVGLWIVNGPTRWNPLTDDGDALRLAVSIKMDISANNDFAQACCVIWHRCIYEEIECNGDALAATRRAITRAAAQIGKEMQ